jgi:hypothetical protein
MVGGYFFINDQVNGFEGSNPQQLYINYYT